MSAVCYGAVREVVLRGLLNVWENGGNLEEQESRSSRRGNGCASRSSDVKGHGQHARHRCSSEGALVAVS